MSGNAKKSVGMFAKRMKSFLRYKFLSSKFANVIPDKCWLKFAFKHFVGYPMDFEKPTTYNQKLQWLKLYDRNPEYSRMVDKYEAKNYVAEKMGSEYIIPTYGIWDKFEDIDFDALPNSFVLKCTHDSGGLVICRDKSQLDMAAAKKTIAKSLKKNFYYTGREWPYKSVKPRIIAEQYLEDLVELAEYKMFCFDGEVKIVLLCKGQAHGRGRTNDFCDRELKRLPFCSLNPTSKGELTPPKELPQLIAFAEKLSVGIPQLRVDTYLVNGKIYFGEMTFFHNSGFCRFDPPEWDDKLGEWIKLPLKR